jgi:hypothetical protein
VLRTKTEPWGITSRPFTEKEAARIHLGNQTMRATLRFIKVLNRYRIPWIFEHPQASKAFLTSEWQNILKLPVVHTRTADQCQYGARWRKRTTFAFGNVDPQDTERLGWRCTGRPGFCSRTGKRHHILEGASPSGVPWTRIAQAYPRRLGRAMATAITANLRANIYNGQLAFPPTRP